MPSLTVREVQARLASDDYLGRLVHERTVRNWIYAGRIEQVASPGRALLVSEASVERYRRAKKRRWWGAA